MTGVLITGLALGLASSAHCAAMCGPLVLTVGRHLGGTSRRSQLRHALLYHLGRVSTYALLAVPAGLGGEAIMARGFGRALALAAGGLLLAATASAIRLPIVDGLTSRLSGAVARAFAPVLRWASAHTVAGPIASGALNGVLPCGLVYAALTAAAASASVGEAMLLMIAFGLGTAAVLVAMSAGVAAISPALRVRLRPVAPIVLAVTAAILLVRGAALGHSHPSPVHTAPAAIEPHHSHH
jgi:sulfite exporter TauE/SafE